MNTETKYQVIEIGTGRVMGTYKSLRRARNVSDKLDLEYGCIHYGVKAVAA